MLLLLDVSNHSSQCILESRLSSSVRSKGMMQLCSPCSSHLFLYLFFLFVCFFLFESLQAKVKKNESFKMCLSILPDGWIRSVVVGGVIAYRDVAVRKTNHCFLYGTVKTSETSVHLKTSAAHPQPCSQSLMLLSMIFSRTKLKLQLFPSGGLVDDPPNAIHSTCRTPFQSTCNI